MLTHSFLLFFTLCLDYSIDAYPLELSPTRYFLDELRAGNSIRNTVSVGDVVDRERVYDTIFRLPWRCELVYYGSIIMILLLSIS